jgi:hypothetical protein
MNRQELLNTTLSFPTRCARCRRWYAAFKVKWARWDASVFSNRTQTPVEKYEIVVPDSLRDVVLGFPHTLNLSQCRTSTPANLEIIAKGVDVQIESLETHGGMGRIYTLTDPERLLKIADIRTSWSKYEPANYKTLEARGVPCAKVYVSATPTIGPTAYVVMVLERLEFTMTAFIRAVGRTADFNAAAVAGMLRGILDMLRERKLVYGDLSPDNIMFRCIGPTKYEIALIDPQFLVLRDDFTRVMGDARGESFDTTYLALKVQAIGLLDPAVRKFTDAVCADVLGHVPPEKHTRKWLLNEAPVALFIAYDILRAAHKASK